MFVCVTGVSGSGKSTLINEMLYRAAGQPPAPGRSCARASTDACEGLEQLDKIINIDQSPIGRTPRSNPATYTGVFDQIRDLFAAAPGGAGARLQARAASAST